MAQSSVKINNQTLCEALPYSHISNLELLAVLGCDTVFCSNEFINKFNKFCKQNCTSQFNFNLETEDEFNVNTSNIKANSLINIFHYNIRSLNAHSNALIQLLCLLDVQFDVIILSEIWNFNLNLYCNLLPGFNFYHDLPTNTNIGGIGIYVRKEFECTECPYLKLPTGDTNKIENLWLEIKKGQDIYIIGGIYRHPNGNILEFNKLMEPCLDKIADKNTPCIIAGDINIDLNKFDVNNATGDYLNNLLLHNFIPAILMPTHIGRTKATLIDHIYYYAGHKHQYQDLYYKSGSLINDTTDHLPNYFLLAHNRQDKTYNNRPLIRLFTEKNKSKFDDIVKNINWDHILYPNKNPNIAFDIFHNNIQKAFNECFPLTKQSRKGTRDKKWVTRGIKTSSNVKNKLYRIWIKSRKKADEIKYKKYKNLFEKISKLAEANYYKEMFSIKANGIKKIWKNINILCSTKPDKKIKNSIKSILSGNAETKDPMEIANLMNDYFCSIGKNLSEKLPQSKFKFETYMDKPLNNSIFCNEATENEILKLLTRLKPNKSPGFDNIGPSLLKRCATSFVYPLTFIYNLSLTQGIVPDKLKFANVIPIFKKGDPKLLVNYRPISLLSVFNKILEQIVYDRLINFLNKYKILYKFQFGFRKLHSTSLALIETIDNIYNCLEKSESIIGIYIDLSKAFDTVNYDILLPKIYNYGIRGPIFEWLKNYLKNRTQCVVVGTTKSEKGKITCGVPQGSTLGPLLFLLYVNDIANSVPNEKIKLFADDTNIFISAKDINILIKKCNTVLIKLSNWFLANKLSLNIEKTCFSLFTKQRMSDVNINLKINSVNIKRVSNSKYLGVIIDEDLTWAAHIDLIKSKIVRFSGIFYKLRNFVPSPILRIIYFSMIYPHLIYGVELYANTYAKYLDPLIKVNNRILRIIQNKPIRAHVDTLYKSYNTLPINVLFKVKILQIMHKFTHFPHLLPPTYTDYFTPNSLIHSHNTKTHNDLHQQRFQSSTGQRSIKFKGVKLWNSLPARLKSHMSTNTFKKYVSRHMCNLVD